MQDEKDVNDDNTIFAVSRTVVLLAAVLATLHGREYNMRNCNNVFFFGVVAHFNCILIMQTRHVYVMEVTNRKDRDSVATKLRAVLPHIADRTSNVGVNESGVLRTSVYV
jgi:hypothetical protein